MASFSCGARRGLLPPVEHQQLLEPRQQFAGDLLDLGALVGAELRRRPGEDVEDDQLLLGHVLADVALLLLVQAAGELQQFLEQFLDAPAAGVVALDQRLELLGEVGAGPVQLDQLLQLGADGGLEHLEVGVLVLRFLEALGQRLEVDLRQVQRRRALPRGSSGR